MKELSNWLDRGVREAVQNYWTGRSIRQYFRDYAFSLVILPIMIVRLVTEPILLATSTVFMGIYWALFLIFKLTSGV